MDEGQRLLVQPPAQDERWARPDRTTLAGRISAAAASAIVFHLVLVIGTGWLDQYRRIRATAEQEVPVEVVDEVPQEKPAGTDQPASAPAPKQDAKVEPQQQPQQPESPPKPEALAEPQPAPKAEPKPEPPPQQEQKPPTPTPPVPAQPEPAPTPQPAQTDQPAAGQAAAGIEVLPPPSPDPQADEPADPPTPPEEAVATAEFRMAPPTFRTAAQPAASRETEDGYRNRIYDILRRGTRTPAGIIGNFSVVVSFQVDRAGNLMSSSLLRSSGNPQIDAEALATVRRSAPFPKPPVGILLTFTPLILLGEDGSR